MLEVDFSTVIRFLVQFTDVTPAIRWDTRKWAQGYNAESEMLNSVLDRGVQSNRQRALSLSKILADIRKLRLALLGGFTNVYVLWMEYSLNLISPEIPPIIAQCIYITYFPKTICDLRTNKEERYNSLQGKFNKLHMHHLSK